MILFLSYSEIEISFIVIFMGLGYAAVAASLWPLLSYNVPKKISGTSYGLMQSFQLGGLMLMYEVSGYLMDANADDKGDWGLKLGTPSHERFQTTVKISTL